MCSLVNSFESWFLLTQVPSSKCHTVLQFHYTTWPEYGTPKLAAPLLNLLRAVHTSNPPEAGPITIHCSAGVGRTGIVLAIDYCLKQMKAANVVDVRGFVSRMREHRNYMIQTEVRGQSGHHSYDYAYFITILSSPLPSTGAICIHPLCYTRGHHIWQHVILSC